MVVIWKEILCEDGRLNRKITAFDNPIESDNNRKISFLFAVLYSMNMLS